MGERQIEMHWEGVVYLYGEENERRETSDGTAIRVRRAAANGLEGEQWRRRRSDRSD